MESLSSSKIESIIYIIRNQKVMLDSDLATLYGVEVKRLNEQVRRNLERFPEDFMFQISHEEREVLSSQFLTFKRSTSTRKYLPSVFTECGVAMLSSVLGSPQAIQVNISIMRTFVKLRSYLAMESTLEKRVGKLEKGTNELFKIVFEELDSLKDSVPTHPTDRKKIGLKIN